MGDSILKLDGKTALVFGVASEESIAYAICKSLSSAGCNLVLGFQPRFRSRIQQLLPTLPKNTQIHPIDVNKPDSISNFYKSWQMESPGQKANIVIHAIGYAPREAFDRNLLFVDSDPIDTALRISAHSLQSILRSGLPHFGTRILHNYTYLCREHETRPQLWPHEHSKGRPRGVGSRDCCKIGARWT